MARQRRPLPQQWTHRTAQRVYTDSVRDLQEAASTSTVSAEQLAPVRAHRQSSLHVLWVLTRTEFRARYRSQALGLLWSLLNPLVMMGIISLVFTHLFRSQEKHFPVFLLMGLLLWQWVTGAITAVTTVFIGNADIIKRTIFLRQLLPTATVLSYGINFCIESIALLMFIPIFPGAFKLTPALLLVPVLLGLLALLLIGIGLAVSVLNVIYRDVAYIVNTGLLIFYWLTPVIYPLEVIPYPFRTVLKFSPLAGLFTALRNAIMHGTYPTPLGWAGVIVPTALALLIGWRIYRHYEPMVLDYV
jgi:ABC-type polysaccharide/polyol phosphate export permease